MNGTSVKSTDEAEVKAAAQYILDRPEQAKRHQVYEILPAAGNCRAECRTAIERDTEPAGH
ncbi:MAG: hypothetical protein IIX61_09665 [Loktanella sp.]|nr:hypothetical protein [Loktanella sp.]